MIYFVVYFESGGGMFRAVRRILVFEVGFIGKKRLVAFRGVE